MIHVDHMGKMESREPSTSISEAVKRAAEKLNYSPLKAVSEQARVTEGFLEGLYVFVITASIHLKTIILTKNSNVNNDVAGFHWWRTIFCARTSCRKALYQTLPRRPPNIHRRWEGLASETTPPAQRKVE